MRKMFALILAALLAASLAVNAAACTPRLKIPKVPQISNIRLEPKLDEDLEEAVDNEVENHVSKWICKIDFSKFDFTGIKFN